MPKNIKGNISGLLNNNTILRDKEVPVDFDTLSNIAVTWMRSHPEVNNTYLGLRGQMEIGCDGTILSAVIPEPVKSFILIRLRQCGYLRWVWEVIDKYDKEYDNKQPQPVLPKAPEPPKQEVDNVNNQPEQH